MRTSSFAQKGEPHLAPTGAVPLREKDPLPAPELKGTAFDGDEDVGAR